MENEICPILENCILFNKPYLLSDFFGVTYKRMFCMKPSHNNECKRYKAYLEAGIQVPEYIMPNSQLSVEEIILKIE